MGGPPRGGFGGGPGFAGRGGFGGGFGGGPGAMGGRSQIFVSNVRSPLHSAMNSQANNIYSFPTTWAGRTSRTCSAKVVSTRDQANLKLEHR
jgi:hypothetical protein